MGWIGLILLIGAGLFILLRGDAGTIGGLETGDFAALVAGLALIAFIGIPALRSYKGRYAQGLKDAAVWLGLALILVGIYSFRDEFTALGHRIAGELLPPGSAINVSNTPTLARAVRIRKRPDGHFAIRGKVNGTPMALMVDTGASSVVLKYSDARKIGIDVDKLRFTVPVRTANGTSFAAPIVLKAVTIGTITIARVTALVSKPGKLNESLLGMSFLTRLRSYEFSGEFLTLRS